MKSATEARYATTCPRCEKPLPVGTPIANASGKWHCLPCAATLRETAHARRASRSCPGCSKPIERGAEIGKGNGVWMHKACAARIRKLHAASQR